jgi:hypothetical protein
MQETFRETGTKAELLMMYRETIPALYADYFKAILSESFSAFELV